jgi:hypothetical protein
MSFETDVPINTLVVGKRYRFYFNQGILINPVYATVNSIINDNHLRLF